MPSSNQSHTCFLVASPAVQLEGLRTQLQNKRVLCISDRKVPSAPLITAPLISLISRADFVSCVLPEAPTPNLMFELGVASGQGKPLLIFADKLELLPFDISWTRILRTDVIGTPELDSFLDAFLKTIAPSAKHRSSSGTSQRKSSTWNRIKSDLAALQSSPANATERELELLIKRAFEQAGFNSTLSPGPGFGADIALTSPSLNKAFGLPVLVEVKNNRRTKLRQSEVEKLSKMIEGGMGGIGLVVTLKEREMTDPPIHLSQPVVILPVEELFSWLESGSFIDELSFTIEAFWGREH